MIRRGVAAIVFRKEGRVNKYLVLKRTLNWKGWEILKGGCKSKENLDNCLIREVKEEIGADQFLFEKTRFVNQFKYSKEFLKDKRKFKGAKHQVYLVEIFSKKIKLDKKEHSGFKWLGKRDAIKILTWDNQKELFNKLIK